MLIDGRILDIAATGFLEGDLVIAEFVLDELRHIADSADTLKRTRRTPRGWTSSSSSRQSSAAVS